MTHWPELSIKWSHKGVKHPVMTPGPDALDGAGIVHSSGSRKKLEWQAEQDLHCHPLLHSRRQQVDLVAQKSGLLVGKDLWR